MATTNSTPSQHVIVELQHDESLSDLTARSCGCGGSSGSRKNSTTSDEDPDFFPDGHGATNLEGVECKMSMLLNRHTIGACFFSKKLQITNPDAFAAICVAAVILALILESTRRGMEELDRYLLNEDARWSKTMAVTEEKVAAWREKRRSGKAANEEAAVSPVAVSEALPATDGSLEANPSPAATDDSSSAAAPSSPVPSDFALTDPDAIALARLSLRSLAPTEADENTTGVPTGKSPTPTDPDTVTPRPPLPKSSISSEINAMTPASPAPKTAVSSDSDTITPAPSHADYVMKSKRVDHHANAADPVQVTEKEVAPLVEKYSRLIEILPPRVSHFRPTWGQQVIRSLMHAFQFTIAFFLMLLAMYMNIYILTSICLGIFVGSFIFQWDKMMY